MISLTATQARIIGVMLEKETTTPEQYPLSLNALTNGCNQKSNREPVMSLSESDVQQGIDELVQMNLLMVDRKSSSRVPKYTHRFCNTEFGDLQFSAQQRGIICVMLLRGAQTPGELRTRTNRLAEFADVAEVEMALNQLQDHNGKQLVQKLEREPGKRENRWVNLFVDQSEAITSSNEQNIAEAMQQEDGSLQQRVEQLEQEVAELKQQIAELLS
ncbi:DUF480 domain-containing protein [Thalassotalea sp. HSM 43]|uniref:YceH family protein n=1 Tax=Thalassotalea sp. HSM 43 TaxID=2552945 RepID=UPI001080BF11|nr:DUF480 domain-containing protein [Thalassotalea sp. HSM 43]QBY04117.1 DUF480 domain-containing protein [Thalassotalea sp. HSM 43]